MLVDLHRVSWIEIEHLLVRVDFSKNESAKFGVRRSAIRIPKKKKRIAAVIVRGRRRLRTEVSHKMTKIFELGADLLRRSTCL